MQIISLNEIQFKNYSRIHSKRNYFQTVEFANVEKINGYNALYVGMIDDNNNLVAASLILNKKFFSKYIYGNIPGGHLIDYDNYDLLNTYTNLLKKYLYKLNYVYIFINPLVPIKSTDKNNNILYENKNIINNINKTGYKKSQMLGITNSINLNTNGNIKQIFNNFSRFVKRNIKENKLMGIKITKSEDNGISEFYSLIRKKTKYDIKYYENYFNNFNSNYNLFEIYFANLNPHIYLENCNNILTKERKKNAKLTEKILDSNVKSKNYYINKKLHSDRLIEKYSKELQKAIKLNNIYKKDFVVATVAIIKNVDEIYFFVEGYEEEFRDIRAIHSITWDIIKKYSKLGYKKFNLGYTPQNKDKFKGIYFSKLGFNANIIEYPGNHFLVINNKIFNFLNMIENKIK